MISILTLLNVQWGFEGVKGLINIHPLFVHFPIAFLLGSVAFYLLGTVFKNDGLLTAGKWTLYFGTLAAAVTVWTGLEAAKTVPHGGGTHEIMMMHQMIGYTVLTLSVLLSGWVFFSRSLIPAKGKFIFLAVLTILGGIIMQGADLGGRMVFLNGVGVGQKGEVEETAHSHGDGGHGEEGHHESAGKEHAGNEHGGKEHAGSEHGGTEHH